MTDLDKLTPTQFENLCENLLRALGFTDINWRKGANGDSSPGDDGCDLVAKYLRIDPDGSPYQETWAIECKHYQKSTVPFSKIEPFLTFAETTRPNVALIITSGYLSNGTKRGIEKWKETRKVSYRIKQWEKEELLALLAQTQSGSLKIGPGLNPVSIFVNTLAHISHENSLVRSGTLTALEKLGEEIPDLRQGVVNTICEYLRTKKEVADSEVRRAAQEILRRHLTWSSRRWDKEPPRELWENINIDLREATLIDFNLDHGYAQEAKFDGAKFLGDARFHKVNFEELASFSGATFEDDADFSGAQFGDSASFEDASFAGKASFNRSHFEGVAEFTRVRFEKYATFNSAKIGSVADFSKSTFEGDAVFSSVSIKHEAEFQEVKFNSEAAFDLARFGDTINFRGSVFRDLFTFSGATAEDIHLGHSLPSGYKILREVNPGLIVES